MLKRIYILGFAIMFFSCTKEEHFDLILDTQNNDKFAVNIEQADSIAENINFLIDQKDDQSKRGGQEFINKSVTEVIPVKNKENELSFYTINFKEGGWVLLASDKRVNPILAYSEDGSFNPEKAKTANGISFWMDKAYDTINELKKNKEQSLKLKKLWGNIQVGGFSNALPNGRPMDEPDCSNYTEFNEKLLTFPFKWRQGGGFNDALHIIQCDDNTSTRAVAGCVPIAIAQVMRYHEFPTNYNWGNMSNTVGNTTSANFILDIHNAIDNRWWNEPSYSCETASEAVTGVGSNKDKSLIFTGDFGYSSATQSSFIGGTVRVELNNNRPVILSGSSSTGGHMWVTEGYQLYTYHYDDCTGTSIAYYRMNWGWGSSSDGFYSSSFDPSGNNGPYNSNQKMIYNIRP
ncbi:C10 family peptidase [Marivirga harenae]|uniref:C10 family peptidase n=1 Tax=Marivirga harenae TaxID=2010992 RepID=UPI0026DFB6BD|nr:C10 family peptidase [Marivirga harenae]WKV10531.1 C10 family peptidase [Marivirga harenae]|tara:strand:- start:487681 stop:488892 length:1212 start_codon:yes stop_codon:yes gene_type:complete